MLSVASVPQLPPDSGREIAFAGRSNAGKSSAINALTQRKSLARTSKTPGQTRFLNYFALDRDGRERLVDLPGYGYAEVPDAERRRWLPLLDALRERDSLAGLFLIVDARRGLREEDAALVDWARPDRRPVHVLLAKADKLNRKEQQTAVAEARAAIGEAPNVTWQLFSAHAGEGVAAAQKRLTGWLRGEPER